MEAQTGVAAAATAAVASQVQFQTVDASNMPRLRSLNTVLFPVHYSSSFYRGLLLPGQFAQLATFGNAYVGTIACRKQPLGFAAGLVTGTGDSSDNMFEMYMMTLGVLAPYRRLGVGRQLLLHAIEFAKRDPLVAKIVLHVQIDNDDALRFYHKHGFTTVRMVERYYKVINPPHAYLLEYRLI
ncbi:N-acetyltransferase 5 [Coemansia aciculifera]|uniref:N-acetyltransferase 5 n=1 Tax=Coemansia aciculifera TaxID=417176 RepID=A0ACC1LZH7_9FUNG|nr:N-acetyltransferase 5 [Coemansia aciculifera]KAJ2904921.1 N-acetyltransferase 5 [Coemansia aciculifera]